MTLFDYRDKDGELSRKHGNTLIGTLRSHYGSDFAAGCSESDRLTDVLDQLDEGSLNKLARDYEAGQLVQIFPNCTGCRQITHQKRLRICSPEHVNISACCVKLPCHTS
jgi:hypothetical protein